MSNSSFWRKAIGFFLIVFFVLFLFLGWFYLFTVSPRNFVIFPRQNELVSSRRQTIGASWTLFPGEKIEVISLSLDEKDITKNAEISDSGFMYLSELSEGKHLVRALLKYSFVKDKVIEVKWIFEVDSVSPKVTFENMMGNKIGITQKSAFLSGKTEPNTSIKAFLNGFPLSETKSNALGEFFLGLGHFKELNELKVKAVDKAKNITDKTFLVLIDESIPIITEVFPHNESIIKDNKVSIKVKVDGIKTDARAIIYLNGEPVNFKAGRSSLEIFTDDLILDEGDYKVEVVVKNIAGNTASTKWVFKVDSTDEFGFCGLREGAKGKDVMELQARLQAHGYYQGRIDGVFNQKTKESVVALQIANNLSLSGVVGFDEANILKPPRFNLIEPISDAKIVISVSKRALYLYKGEELLRVYPIAVGGRGFPTPIRKFKIVRKDVNPTWYPPDWADVEEPVPPGPSNPLGDRRLLLSDRNYGIHGTNKPSSIGKAVTHGCIRMYPSDILELFKAVSVGTVVDIRR